MDIRSVEYATRNADGLEQVTIEYKQTLLRRLFRRDHVKVFVNRRLIGWRNVETGEQPSMHESYCIAEACLAHKSC